MATLPGEHSSDEKTSGIGRRSFIDLFNEAAKVGYSLTARPAGVSGYPAPSLAYQWQKASSLSGSYSSISNATKVSYKPVTADINKHLRVRVTVTNSTGSSSAFSVGIGPTQKQTP